MKKEDPERDTPRRRGFGAGFWIAIMFGILCVAAGLGVARFGPKYMPPAASR